MTSRAHGSEKALATLAIAGDAEIGGPRVLVGGLGFGYTLRAALDALPADAEVVVAELFDLVLTANRGEVGELAGRPLDDPRVSVRMGDVARRPRRRDVRGHPARRRQRTRGVHARRQLAALSGKGIGPPRATA